jgi:acyl-CoA synthetase (AMP-forming)/AMP-acid ligase II
MLTPIRTETAQNIALNMFVLSTGYTFGSGPTGELGATTGGGTFTATPEFRVPGLNGLRKNTKGFMVIDEWEVSLKCSAVELTEAGLLLAAGYGSAATDANVTTITPAQGLVPDSEYADLWVSGNTSDGKIFAICIKNALNNNGVQLSFADKDTGKYDIDVRGNYTAATLDTPPFIIYLDKSVATAAAIALSSIVPTAGSTGAVESVVMTFNNAISSHAVTVVLASSGAIIDGAFSYDATHKVLTFTPTSAFASALHIVNITGVTDIYGQTLASSTSVFTVA